ncbi:MAG TPA: DMT family transporter [Conexibacter sp.]|nr:DMT family transporter [Conexibacter sp.]
MLPLVLALGASVAWGVSDFLGGLESRSGTLVAVMVASQGWSLLAIAAVVVASGAPLPDAAHLRLAIGGGVTELIGFAALYRGLARGPMSIVAPLSTTAAVVPLAAGLLAGTAPRTWQAAGIAIAIGGVAVAAVEEAHEHEQSGRSSHGVLCAAVAALGFGTSYVLIADAAAGGALGAVLVARGSSAAVMACCAWALVGGAPSLGGAGAVAVAACGVLEAGATMLFAVAATHGLTSIVAAISSLYPLTTAALAQLVLRERLNARQLAGVSAAVAGVALIALG